MTTATQGNSVVGYDWTVGSAVEITTENKGFISI